MTRMVFCLKYQEELEGVAIPPMPGKKGEYIFNNISKKAWSEWQSKQTMLINEKHLNMMDPNSRAYLAEQMDNFLNNKDTDEIEGYTPPKP